MISLNAPIWIELMDAGDECATEYDSTVIWKSAEGNLENQIALIEGFIEQKVDCILIDPIDAIALIPVIQEALNAGIPFVTMGNLVEAQVSDTLYNTCTTYPDVRDTAALTDMIIAAGGSDKTYIGVAGTVGNFVSDTRKQAFVDTCVAAGVSHLEADGMWDPNTTLKVTQDMVQQAGANLGGLYNLDDSMALISMQATPSGLAVAGHNGEEAAFEKIDTGEMLCTILIGGRHIGYWNILTAVQLAQGIELPHQVYLKTYMVMSDESKAAYWDGNLDAKYPNLPVINTTKAREEAAKPAEMLDSLD
jgi:ribose transport system substrate-binding protein